MSFTDFIQFLKVCNMLKPLRFWGIWFTVTSLGAIWLLPDLVNSLK